MITVEHLTKRYGTATAVDDLSFDVPAGAVTGFIGPNGAGKSTTIRAILGLDHPTSGRALIDGTAYRALPQPMRTVGAVTDPHAVQQGRTAIDHLRWAAATGGIGTDRVQAVMNEVGLSEVATRRIKALSLGMRQRLAIALALLGEPRILILDEPLNGLDPSGIVWLRSLLKNHAADGGAVLVSSHLLHELQETADRVVLLANGRLIAEQTMGELVRRTKGATRVVCEDAERLAAALEEAGGSVARERDDALAVQGVGAALIGRIALDLRIALSELTPQPKNLEARFLALTSTPQEIALRTTEEHAL